MNKAYFNRRSLYLSVQLLVLFIVVGLWLKVVYFIVVASFPFNPFTNKIEPKERQFIKTMLPEGFSFFTKNPREPYFRVYKIISGDSLNYMEMNPFSLTNLGGLIRRNKVVYVQLGGILEQLKGIKWATHRGVNDLPLHNLKLIKVENESDTPLVCGKYLLEFRKPVPWAWSGSVRPGEMESKIIKINILCLD